MALRKFNKSLIKFTAPKGIIVIKSQQTIEFNYLCTA